MAKRITIFALALLLLAVVSACSRESKDAGKGEKAFVQEMLESTNDDKDTADNTVGKTVAAETIADAKANAGKGATAGTKTTADTETTIDTELTADTETTIDTELTADTETTTDTELTADTETTTNAKTTSASETTQDIATVSNNDTDSGHTASKPNSIDGSVEVEINCNAETISLDAKNNPDDESRILEGFIICIDPGHQSHGNYDTEPVAPGSDEMKAKVSSGTAGVKTRIPEYKLNLAVSLKLRDALEKYGATVILTRTENDVDISNAERAAIANEVNADLYFRIHADGSTDKSINGVSVLIPGKGHITDKYILEESEKAGGCILKGFIEATGAERRGMPKRNDLSGFNWCKVPMVLIEMGFMSNVNEDEKLNSSEYQDKMVAGMTNGIIDYFQQK